METMKIIDKCFDVMADIPNEQLNYVEIEGFLSKQDVKEELKDMFRILIRLEERKRVR